MQENSIQLRAERIRDVIRYISKFKNAAVVIYIDDRCIGTPMFTSHIRDIALIHEAGLRVLLVPGAHTHIDAELNEHGIPWTITNGCRITSDDAMPFIKTAAFEASNKVMTSLAGKHLTAVIGNWVRARGKGVIDGIDYGCSGEIDRIEDEAIHTVLDNGFIPIFPCIGWSLAGKPYNISSIQLATQIAMHLQADKLFFLVPDAELSEKCFMIPPEIGLSPEGNIPAMTIEESQHFLETNQQPRADLSASDRSQFAHIRSMVQLARTACLQGVTRVHIVNSSLDGTLPCEIFSNLGSGTMIYASNYGKIRAMTREDIAAVLSLMRPFVERKILLPRSEEQLQNQYGDYVVYELDGAIRACAALHCYDSGDSSKRQAEIAGLAVDESCAHIGIGPKILSHLIDRARQQGLSSVFVLTTQTSDWFEKIGFTADSIASMPEKRRALWSPERGSKLLRLQL